MIHGVGVDIIHIPRLASLCQKRYAYRLPRRILTDSELTQYHALPTSSAQLKFLTTRWAIKEAAYKACQPIHSSWKDATVRYSASGTPELDTSESIPLEFKCSVSHDGEYCVAYVTALKRPRNNNLNDKRGTGEMIDEYERDVPRRHEKAADWIEKW